MNEISGAQRADGSLVYERGVSEIGPQFANSRGNITPRNAFKQFILQHVYNDAKDWFRTKGEITFMVF